MTILLTSSSFLADEATNKGITHIETSNILPKCNIRNNSISKQLNVITILDYDLLE